MTWILHFETKRHTNLFAVHTPYLRSLSQSSWVRGFRFDIRLCAVRIIRTAEEGKERPVLLLTEPRSKQSKCWLEIKRTFLEIIQTNCQFESCSLLAGRARCHVWIPDVPCREDVKGSLALAEYRVRAERIEWIFPQRKAGPHQEPEPALWNTGQALETYSGFGVRTRVRDRRHHRKIPWILVQGATGTAPAYLRQSAEMPTLSSPISTLPSAWTGSTSKLHTLLPGPFSISSSPTGVLQNLPVV